MWRGSYEPIEFEGRTYGLRAHELRKLASLPRRTGQRFELALDIDESDAADRRLLEDEGWELVDPRAVAGDPRAYRAYIQRSQAELLVAKHLYVGTRSGWFSDRSACYLASGKPVVALDTGFGGVIDVGEGLVAFASVEEAVAVVQDVVGAYDRHARAARELAVEHFNSDRVLGKLLERLALA
jgi:hypothetical protein